jgi:hypothetical protein
MSIDRSSYTALRAALSMASWLTLICLQRCPDWYRCAAKTQVFSAGVGFDAPNCCVPNLNEHLSLRWRLHFHSEIQRSRKSPSPSPRKADHAVRSLQRLGCFDRISLHDIRWAVRGLGQPYPSAVETTVDSPHGSNRSSHEILHQSGAGFVQWLSASRRRTRSPTDWTLLFQSNHQEHLASPRYFLRAKEASLGRVPVHMHAVET